MALCLKSHLTNLFPIVFWPHCPMNLSTAQSRQKAAQVVTLLDLMLNALKNLLRKLTPVE